MKEEPIHMDTEVLLEIRDAEKKADEIIKRAQSEKESMIKEASAISSKLIASKESEIMKQQEKKLAEFREKSRIIKDEKISESRTAVKQLKAKADKNAAKATDFVMKKFEEMILGA